MIQYMSKKGVGIDYFDQPYSIQIRIKKDGTLSDNFGPGFIDESLKWQTGLMNTHNKN